MIYCARLKKPRTNQKDLKTGITGLLHFQSFIFSMNNRPLAKSRLYILPLAKYKMLNQSLASRPASGAAQGFKPCGLLRKLAAGHFRIAKAQDLRSKKLER